MGSQIAAYTPEGRFLDTVSEIFGISPMASLEVYTKLSSFVAGSGVLTTIKHDDIDGIYDDTQKAMVSLNLRSIVRQVIVPLAGGALAAIVAVEIFSVTALAAALIGALVTLVLFYRGARAAGADISATLDRILEPIRNFF